MKGRRPCKYNDQPRTSNGVGNRRNVRRNRKCCVADYMRRSVASCWIGRSNIPQAKQSFLALDNPFADTVVISDLHAACLGAHDKSGALIICGTGSAATRYDKGVFTDKGGYGLQLAMMQVVRGWAISYKACTAFL